MTPIEDVWGIGRRLRKQMEYFGVKTAYDFTLKSESWVRKEFSVTGLRTWKELRGLACIDFEAGNKKKKHHNFQELQQINHTLSGVIRSCCQLYRCLCTQAAGTRVQNRFIIGLHRD